MLKFLKLNSPKKGFSLIELMVVISIVSVITSLSIPKFMGFKVKAAQAEGKFGINVANAHMISASASGATSGEISDFTSLGLTGAQKKYEYVGTVNVPTSKFGALAFEKGNCANRGISSFCNKGDVMGVGDLGLTIVYDSHSCPLSNGTWGGFGDVGVASSLATILVFKALWDGYDHHGMLGCP